MSIFSKINPFKRIKNKLNHFKMETEIQINKLEKKMIIHEKIYIKELLKLKKKVKSTNNEKINIVFVCHDYHAWGTIKTICSNCIEDEKFNVKIVIIPGNVTQLESEKQKYEKVQHFFADYKCKIIQGYNYDLKEWLDLRALDPDYLFFQVPYDVYRPPQYASDVVSSYTSLCYVPYSYPLFGKEIEEIVYPKYFFKNLYCIFVHSQKRKEWLLKRFNDIDFFDKNNVEVTGSPRFDYLDKYKNSESSIWKYIGNNKKFRIIWTPRWTTSEGLCNFFKYKSLFLNYARCNKDVEIVLRPHPLMWSNFISTKEMELNEIEKFKKEWISIDNMSLDESSDYYDKFFSSDVLVSDSSTIFGPYFLTGNPLIYCHTNDSFNDTGENLAKGFYWTHSWEEVEQTLNMLKHGKDPLQEKRQQIINSDFYLPEKGAGFEIKNFLKRDFYKR